MRLCLVDDDSTQLNYLKLVIQKWSNENNVVVDIDFYHSAEEMLFESDGSYPFDMILLDIQMDKINGIELGKKIREKDKTVIIAFLSGISDYVYEGYEVQAIRYLLKPVKNEELFSLLDYALSRLHEEKNYLIVSISGEKKKISYDDILYVESMSHNLIIHLISGTIEYKYNLRDLCLDLANSNFIQTHRSYVVNLKYLEKITRSECLLIHNISVPLSRNSYKSVNKKFIEYYKGKGI